MYDAPIPIINYVMVGITASVLAYATAMDVKDNNDTNSSTTAKLPAYSDENTAKSVSDGKPDDVETKEQESIEQEPIEQEPEPIEQTQEAEPREVDARIANSLDTNEPVANAMPVAGGKHNRKKHKKTTNRKKHKPKQKRNQTRNKLSRK